MKNEPETNGPVEPPPAPGWPVTNSPRHPIPTGGKLLRGSNAWMLNGLGGQPTLYSAGRVIHSKMGAVIQTKLAVITCGGTTGPMKNMKQGPQFVDWTNSNPDYAVAVRDPADFEREKEGMRDELAIKTASDISLRAMCWTLEKLAAHEPVPADHPSAPAEQLRPRVEVIIYGDDGVKAIDKTNYMLMPGGGIDDGEEPRDALIRETHEELGHNLANIEPGPVVESLWPDDFPGATPGFKGERTHFFTALDNGPAGMAHEDKEEFATKAFADISGRLTDLIADPKQVWAKANNQARKDLVEKASKRRDEQAIKRAAAAPTAPTSTPTLPGVPQNPAAQFISNLAAPLKQSNQGLPIRPTTPGQSTTQLPPGVFNPTPNDIQNQADQTGLQTKTADDRIRLMCANLEKYGQTLLPDDSSGVDISGGELTPGPVDYAQDIQAAVHGQPQANKIIQFAQLDPSTKAPNNQQGPSPVPPPGGQQMKQADVVKLLPKKQFLLFTPDGKVVVKRLGDRRFTLPDKGEGRPAPYEHSVQLIPQQGVPEPGYQGYDLGLHVGQTADVPQGFEALPPQDVLKDLYAGMGLSKNRPFMQVDRSRARGIVRYLKSTAPKVADPAAVQQA